jgi:hypothetical protein
LVFPVNPAFCRSGYLTTTSDRSGHCEQKKFRRKKHRIIRRAVPVVKEIAYQFRLLNGNRNVFFSQLNDMFKTDYQKSRNKEIAN